jgi:hypothetical protein
MTGEGSEHPAIDQAQPSGSAAYVAARVREVRHASPRRRQMGLRKPALAVVLSLLGFLLISSSGWGLLRSIAAPGWSWYKTDTHVHSVVSGDALSDLGILSKTAKEQGYDAFFLTDHNGGSNFQISTWVANNVVFPPPTGSRFQR